MNTQEGRTEGFWLSVPNPSDGLNPIMTNLPNAMTIEEAREDATDAGMESFIAAGYEDAETVYATLYQIAPNGGLVTSECFTISGPEAE